jgi:hypothetical protein
MSAIELNKALCNPVNLGAAIRVFGALPAWTRFIVGEIRRRQTLWMQLDLAYAELSALRGDFWNQLREA